MVTDKRTHGPWIAHLNSCQEMRMYTTKFKSHSPTLKFILGITQVITKAYQVTKFNKIKHICTVSSLTFITNAKGQECIRSNILSAKCDMHHNPCQKKIFWTFDPIRGSMWCKRTEHLYAWWSMLHSNYLFCNITTFRKESKLTFRHHLRGQG